MAEWEQLNHVIVQSDSYGAYMPTGGFCHYLERKHGCLVHLGAIGREVLDGTELRDELDGWGPSKQGFGTILTAFASQQGMVGSTSDSSEVSDVFEYGEDTLWEMEGLQLGRGSSPYSSESESDESVLHPPAKRKRPS